VSSGSRGKRVLQEGGNKKSGKSPTGAYVNEGKGRGEKLFRERLHLEVVNWLAPGRYQGKETTRNQELWTRGEK